jgi:EmrB/QacA subfamily drug resistance transporter
MPTAHSDSDTSRNGRRRWLALVVVCMAQLMIVLDTTIVNVALPVIQHDLRFTQGNLTWVVNAFLITCGSLLLLAGRLSDLIGRRRLFIAGVLLFTTASALCGLAPSQYFLIAARALQGVGAALQSSVILAIIVTEFPGPDERAKAMSAYVFTAVAGGSLGLLAGGVLTEALSWHWIFFVNLPIGLATVAAGRALIPRDPPAQSRERVDYLGSVLVTASLMLAVYAIVQATTHGWGSLQVLGFGAIAATLMAAFIAVQARVANPIMPLRILRLRRLIGGGVVRALLVTGMYSNFFLGTIYLERVLHYSAVAAGAAFLPWTLTVAALSLGVTARLMRRYGPMRVLVAGMTAVIGGLVVLAGTGPHTSFFPTLFIAFFAFGLGIGSAFMPLMTMAMAEVPAADAGLGSGITTLSQQVGGAVGLAALGTIATSHTRALAAHHVRATAALLGGDHLAYVIGAVCVLGAIALSLVVLRAPQERAEGVAEPVAIRVAVAAAVEQPPEAEPHRDRRLNRGLTRVRGARGHQPAARRGERTPLRSPDSPE